MRAWLPSALRRNLRAAWPFGAPGLDLAGEARDAHGDIREIIRATNRYPPGSALTCREPPPLPVEGRRNLLSQPGPQEAPASAVQLIRLARRVRLVGRAGERAQREVERLVEGGLEVVQDDALAQGPGTYVDRADVEGLHRRPGDHRTGDDLLAARA